MIDAQCRLSRLLLRAFTILAVLTASLSWTTRAHADFPERSVRLVVGFPPGGSDITARVIAQKLSQIWGQTIVVDNKPGAAGNIGAELVARAKPDGYTLLLCVNSYTINTSVYPNLGWDLLRDFTPVARYATSPMVVVVNEKTPARTLGELVAYAKANPGKLNFGSAGMGTAPHLAVEQFKIDTGTFITHIPYRGSAPSVTALLADEVQLAFGARSAFDSFIKSGRLRPLAVTTASRDSALPSVPTVSEALKLDFDADIWYGILAPAKTPQAIVDKLNEDIGKVLADPEIQAKLRDAGVSPAYLGSAPMGALMQRDVTRWREVAQRIRLKLE